MFHIFIAVLIANQQIKIFESTETFQTEQACKEQIPKAVHNMEVVINKAKLDAKVLKGICAPEPKKADDENSI